MAGRRGKPVQAWMEDSLRLRMEALAARMDRTLSKELRRACIVYLRHPEYFAASLEDDAAQLGGWDGGDEVPLREPIPAPRASPDAGRKPEAPLAPLQSEDAAEAKPGGKPKKGRKKA
jgi:hypothetical protein